MKLLQNIFQINEKDLVECLNSKSFTKGLSKVKNPITNIWSDYITIDEACDILRREYIRDGGRIFAEEFVATYIDEPEQATATSMGQGGMGYTAQNYITTQWNAS